MEARIAFENGQISNYEGLVTLTLDQVTFFRYPNAKKLSASVGFTLDH